MTTTEEDEGEELDDVEDDKIKYIKTTQCEFPPKSRSSRSASGSAPTATGSGLTSFSQNPGHSRAPTSTSARGRVGRSTKATRKGSKKFETALTPEEELAAARQKEENRNAARVIYHNNDFPGIKDIQKRHNLPETGTWDTDVSSELAFMDAEWQKKHPTSFFKTHIFTVEEVKEHLENMSRKADIPADLKAKYQKALNSLAQQSIRTPFPKPSKETGGRNVLMQQLAVVMVDETGMHTTQLDSDIHHREMMGLQTLHKCSAIYRGQISSIGGAYCSFCDYVGEHHVAINNHIRCHWHLGLMCLAPFCFQVHTECEEMIRHMASEHGATPPGHKT